MHVRIKIICDQLLSHHYIHVKANIIDRSSIFASILDSPRNTAMDAGVNAQFAKRHGSAEISHGKCFRVKKTSLI